MLNQDVKSNTVGKVGQDTAALVELMNELFPDGDVQAANLQHFSTASAPPAKAQTDLTDNAEEHEDHEDQGAIADLIAHAVENSFSEKDRISFDLAVEDTLVSTHDASPRTAEDELSGEISEESISEDTEEEGNVSSEPIPEEKKKNKKSKHKRVTGKKQKKITPPRETHAKKSITASAAPEMTTEPDYPPQFSDVHDFSDHAPGTDYVKIGRSTVSVSPKEYFTATFSGILERQKDALPEAGVNIRSHEKRLSVITGIDRAINPIRIVIIVLMSLCIAGRKFPWMTLGFMKGMGGVNVSVVLTVLAMVVCWQSTYRAFYDIFYLRFSHESYLLIATVLTVLEAVTLRNETSLLPFLTMSWCVCGISNLMHNQANLRGLRSLITSRGRTGIRIGKEKWDSRDVIGKAPAGTTGFVRRQAEPDAWHSLHTPFLIFLMIIAMVSSAYISAKNQVNYLSVLVLLLNISMPVSMALSSARAYNLLSQTISGKGIISGWFGIKAMSGRKSVMIYDNDLFPKGSIGHRGVKVYGRMTASQLVTYGASMVLRAGIGLDDVFMKYARDIDAQLVEVTGLQVQEGGIEGRIHRNRVQLGTYQYMQLMGIDVPINGSGNSIYIAVNGHLQGLFAIKYTMRSGSISGFHRFVREKTLTSLVVTRIFNVNPAFIEKHFKAPITRIVCPKSEKRRALSNKSTLSGGTVCGYVLKDGISPYSRVVGGARRVYRMGLVYALSSVALSFYLMLDTIGALSSGMAIIEAPRLLLLHLILFLVVEIGARIAVKQ